MEFKTLPNLGFIVDDLPSDILEDFVHQIKDIKKDTDNVQHQKTYLDNNFNNVYKLSYDEKFVHYLLNLANSYVSTFDTFDELSIFDNRNISISLQELWVNFQNKYEFNPNHKHTGIFSFAIYVDIPYALNRSNPTQIGSFEFTYTNTLGNLTNYNIPADKNYNGKILFFPSKMMHCVYPFYNSDKTRVTISGNIKPILETT